MENKILLTDNEGKPIEDFDKFFSENPEILERIKSLHLKENLFEKYKEILMRSKNLNYDNNNISENIINAEMMFEIDNYLNGIYEKISNLSDEISIKKFQENISIVTSEIISLQYTNPILKRSIEYFKARLESFEDFINIYVKRFSTTENKSHKKNKIQLELNKSQIAYLITKMEEKGIFRRQNNPNYLKIFSEIFKTKDNKSLTNNDLSRAIFNFQNTKTGFPKDIQNIDDFIDEL